MHLRIFRLVSLLLLASVGTGCWGLRYHRVEERHEDGRGHHDEHHDEHQDDHHDEHHDEHHEAHR